MTALETLLALASRYGAIHVRPVFDDDLEPAGMSCWLARMKPTRCSRSCDPNGYATLRESVAATPEFWKEMPR